MPTIRLAIVADANRLAVLATQVWLHTYAPDGVTSEVAEFVLSEFSPQRYQALLRDADYRILLAENNDHLLGLAVLKLNTPCTSAPQACAELQTLYVQAPHQGMGIGRALLIAAQNEARPHGPIWLTAYAQNTRAIAFYQRQGFRHIGISYFELGDQRHENQVLIAADIS